MVNMERQENLRSCLFLSINQSYLVFYKLTITNNKMSKKTLLAVVRDNHVSSLTNLMDEITTVLPKTGLFCSEISRPLNILRVYTKNPVEGLLYVPLLFSIIIKHVSVKQQDVGHRNALLDIDILKQEEKLV